MDVWTRGQGKDTVLGPEVESLGSRNTPKIGTWGRFGWWGLQRRVRLVKRVVIFYIYIYNFTDEVLFQSVYSLETNFVFGKTFCCS